MINTTKSIAAIIIESFLLLALVALFSTIPSCLDQQEAKRLCEELCHKILIEAKADPPEYGEYEAVLEERDPWKNQLISVLHVSELNNRVLVKSCGPDGLVGTSDDIYELKQDVHIRKIVAKGIESGAHSAGKGLTTGVMEGLGEASHAVVDKAKNGITNTKNKFMSKFKKQGEN